MTDKPSIVESLSAVMADVQAVRKGERNDQQGYSFRGIDAVVNAVGPALRAHGVVVLPVVEDSHYDVVEVGRNRTQMRQATVTVRYVFVGPAGDRLEAVSVGEAMDSGDKATPKAMSVAFRVALLQALCIPTDEADPDSQSYERAPAVDVNDLRDGALAAGSMDALRALHAQARRLRLLDEPVTNEHGDTEALGELIVRLGNDRIAAAKAASGTEQVDEPAEAAS